MQQIGKNFEQKKPKNKNIYTHQNRTARLCDSQAKERK